MNWKKILTTIVVTTTFLIFSNSAFSSDTFDSKETASIFTTVEMSVSADFSAQNLSADLSSGALYEVSIKTSVDESVVFSITDDDGVPLFSGTWTAAATGEAPKMPAAFFIIPKGTLAKGTLSGLGSGTAIIRITSWKR